MQGDCMKFLAVEFGIEVTTMHGQGPGHAQLWPAPPKPTAAWRTDRRFGLSSAFAVLLEV